MFIGEGLALMGSGVAFMATRTGGACTSWVGDTCTARDELEVGPQILMFSGQVGAGLIHVIAGITYLGISEDDERGRAFFGAAIELSFGVLGAAMFAGAAWALATERADGECNVTQDGSCVSVYRRSVNGNWLILGVGGALLLGGTIGGLYMALTAPDATPGGTSFSILPYADPTGFGLDVGGRF